jgi:hypothetical protein
MRRTALRRHLVAMAMVLAATVGLAGPALAEPALADTRPTPAAGKPVVPGAQPATPVPGGYPSWADLYAAQAKLDTAAAAIAAADRSGNASIVVSAEHYQVQVYWAGVVPAHVRSAADATGVPVSFRSARFTHTELVSEAKRMATADGVVTTAPRADGSGLTVTVRATLGPAGRARLASLTRMPLTVEVGTGVQAAFSRQADTPPFWGGARYTTAVGGCTTGFSLKHPTQPDFYSITAAHCGVENGAVNVPGQPSPTGYSFAVLPCRDTMAIGFFAGPVEPRIYTGPFDSATSVHVAGATPDFVGDLIVTGGASSGEHFNVPVQAVDVFTPVGGISCDVVGPLTRAGLSGDQCVVAPGDSGGPVYSYLTDKDVLGRGTITAGNLGSANCPGVSPIGANTVYYAPLVRPAGDPEIGSLQLGGVDLLT